MRTQLSLLGALLPIFTAAIAPANITILSTKISNCDTPITTKPSNNNTSLDILYDTRKSKGLAPDSLASTDSANATETTCVVCMRFRWSNKLYGRIMSLDYDFENRLDPGLLEQVFTTINGEGKPDTEQAYFETSYIYGGEETAKTYHVHTNQPNASEPFLLDFTKAQESLCVQTTFRVIARGGVTHAGGEISRKSVFVQSVNVAWQSEKP
ncbi:uncharacterized protein BDR25DRAFT_381616 [Lindgomyces ingoldianus]|uniref:Uncharacterized protein n=1 Tax=Lindgomyces ingoldianus TaxID=673940 RepID=A0ACB6QCS1_9PLEO|nr:uncharacterized protein BDR25DRAFT_381616 [Lindgomyces ingoldianus]KAF2464172.1 hypothetical protein BDR25DRAFT_381616 [Lindgomyces ingoldianus]